MARCGEGFARVGYAMDHAWEKGKRRLGAEEPDECARLPGWGLCTGRGLKIIYVRIVETNQIMRGSGRTRLTSEPLVWTSFPAPDVISNGRWWRHTSGVHSGGTRGVGGDDGVGGGAGRVRLVYSMVVMVADWLGDVLGAKPSVVGSAK
uniref:Uncharacterized protein n=1 Tax=Oryza punctata TaxID=4537 RepID=A0A0E0LSY3_ORYPU